MGTPSFITDKSTNLPEPELVFHYSKIAEWLGSRSWYQDESVVEAIQYLLPQRPARVLELCCGSGLLLGYLSKAFPRTEFIGVDINPKMVELSKERLNQAANVSILQLDWTGCGLLEKLEPFDVIIIKNALHLIKDLDSKLRLLHRISGAWTELIVIETISPNAEANAFVKKLFEIVDEKVIKKNIFTEKSLTSVLADGYWHLAQNRPIHCRQYIDTEDWLSQRCPNDLTVRRARKFITELRNHRIRKSMEFGSQFGVLPKQMLRLQHVGRYMFVPKNVTRIDLSSDAYYAKDLLF